MALAYQQQKDFTKGITDDRFIGSGFVADAEGVNIRKSSRGVILSSNTPTFDGAITTGDNIFSFAYAKTGINFEVVAFLSDKIRAINGATVYSRVNNTNNDIRSVNYVKSAGVDYGVVITQGYVWRWDMTNNITTMSENIVTLSNTSDYRPSVFDGGFLYVGGNGKVDAIDVSTGTWTIYKTVSIPGTCRGLSMVGDQIFIYSNDGKDGYKMSWDGIAKFPNYILKRPDNPVINISNDGNYDFVVTGNNGTLDNKYRRLLRSSGFEKQNIAISDFILNDRQLFNFSPDRTNAIDVASNVVYIPSKKSIYTFGTKKASLGESLAKEFTLSDGDEITALYVYDNSQLYVGYNKDVGGYENRVKVYDLRDGFNYGSEGYITTLAWDGGDIEAEKNSNRIVVNYKLGQKTTSPTGSTSIDIYAKINGDETRVFTTTGITNAPARGDKYTYNGLEYIVKEYRHTTNELICTRGENGYSNSSINKNAGTLTKTFGVGQSTISFTNVDNYVFIKSITDTTKRKETIMWQEKWCDLEIKAVLKSTEKTITPELYSIKVLFDYIDKQDG